MDGQNLRTAAYAAVTSPLTGGSSRLSEAPQGISDHALKQQQQQPNVEAAIAAQRVAEALEGFAEYAEVAHELWRHTGPAAPVERQREWPQPPLAPPAALSPVPITPEILREQLREAGKVIGVTTQVVVEEQMQQLTEIKQELHGAIRQDLTALEETLRNGMQELNDAIHQDRSVLQERMIFTPMLEEIMVRLDFMQREAEALRAAVGHAQQRDSEAAKEGVGMLGSSLEESMESCSEEDSASQDVESSKGATAGQGQHNSQGQSATSKPHDAVYSKAALLNEMKAVTEESMSIFIDEAARRTEKLIFDALKSIIATNDRTTLHGQPVASPPISEPLASPRATALPFIQAGSSVQKGVALLPSATLPGELTSPDDESVRSKALCAQDAEDKPNANDQGLLRRKASVTPSCKSIQLSSDGRVVKPGDSLEHMKMGGDRVDVSQSLRTGAHVMKTWVQAVEEQEDASEARRISSISKHVETDPNTLPIEDERTRLQVCCDNSRDAMRLVVVDTRFDYVSAFVIIVNSVVVGIQTAYKADHIGQAYPSVFRVLDILFCLVFTCELVLRLFVHRLALYHISDWKWNVFDTVLVILNLFEEISLLIVPTTSSVSMDFSFMRVLRVLRLIRIIRLFRILRVIGELRTIISSIAGCLRPLLSAILLLMLMIYVVAVFFTQVVTDYLEEDESRIAISDLEDHFGSLSRSIFSLYQAVLGGIDWGDIANPLVDDISSFYGFLFVLFIAFSALAIMNVVTGCFVEAALASAKKDEDVYMVNHLKELLKVTDSDGSGAVTWDEFRGQLAHERMIEYFRCINIDVSEARNVFNILDVKEQGVLSNTDFVSGCLKLRGPARALDLERLSFQTRQLAVRSAKQLSYLSYLMRKFGEFFGADLVTDNYDDEAETDKILAMVRTVSSCD